MDETIGANAHLNVGIRNNGADRQRIPVNIAIIGKQRTRVNSDFNAFCPRNRSIIIGYGCIINGGDGDIDLGICAATFGCIGEIAKFGDTVKVSIRCKGNVAVV